MHSLTTADSGPTSLPADSRIRASPIHLRRTEVTDSDVNPVLSRRALLCCCKRLRGQRRLQGTGCLRLTWWVSWSVWQTTKCTPCGSSEQRGQMAAGVWEFSPLLRPNEKRMLTHTSSARWDTRPAPKLPPA